MPIDFSIQHNQQTPQSTATTFSSTATGSLFGLDATVVESPMSLLADAAEELTFAADSTDDFELDERKEREEIDEAMDERIKNYQELMHETGEVQKLGPLRDAISARAGKEHVLRQLRYYFPDPADAWAMLKELRDELAADPSTDEAVLRGVNEALAELEASEGPAIRAGINGALNARGFEGLGSPSELGSLYRKTVCDFVDVNAMFAYIQDRFGGDFDAAVDFLYKALASDMACDTPSMEKSHLEHVNTGLGELRQLQSARSLCAKTLTRWHDVHGVKNCPLNDMALLNQLLDLRKEHFIGASRIARIADDAKAPDIEHKVLFLQELLNTLRAFSPDLFDGAEGRMKVIDAVQGAVDAAIAEEDAWLASQEQS